MTEEKNDDIIKQRQERLDEFQRVLDSLESVKSEKKRLWHEIYENAMVEYEEAYDLYKDLKQAVKGDTHNHSLHGMLITKYLERMNKANDHFLRLAELVEKAGGGEPKINKSDIYEQIAKG